MFTLTFSFTSYSFRGSRLQMIFKAAARKKLAKVIGKHLWWSSLLLKLETVTLQWKNSIKDFFQWILIYTFMRFYQYSESNYSASPITLRQLPCWSNNDLAYQTNEHPFESVVQRCFVNCLAEKGRNIPRKISAVEPYRVVFLKRDSDILEQPSCRAYASISFWLLDSFLVFNRKALLFSLSELTTHRRPWLQPATLI